jgi:hypothetical protein
MRILDGNIFEGMRMILPEHREAMRKVEQEHLRPARPVLDEQKLEEMSRVLAEALQDSRTLTVTVYQSFDWKRIAMIPEKIDPYTKTIKGRDTQGNAVTIALTDVLDVQLES